MIYSIFMRKIQGDANPFPTTILVQKYVNNYVNDTDIVITFPGYMSNTVKTINDFLTSINLPDNTYFNEGMNGTQSLGGTTIQSLHNSCFKLRIGGLIPDKKDHAKMIFFLENHDPKTTWNISELLELNVKAVLIGSSNQSNTTYFRATADKGEADIFLFDGRYKPNKEEYIAENEEEMVLNFFNATFSNYNELKERVAIFREIDQPQISLNKILKESIGKINKK